MNDLRLDVAASTRRGAPRESLDRIASAQRYPGAEIAVSPEAWAALWRARKGRFFGVKPGTAAFAELSAVGLLTGAGTPSSSAQEYLDVRDRTVIALGSEARSGGLTSTWSCWFAPDSALIAAGPQMVASELPQDRRIGLSVVTESIALGLLVQWMGIGPTWTFAHQDGLSAYPRGAVEARIATDETHVPALPAQASWSVSRAWEEGRWTEFEFGVPRTGLGQELIRAGDRDWFRPEPLADGLVDLHTIGTNDVMREVLAVYRRSVDQLVRR